MKPTGRHGSITRGYNLFLWSGSQVRWTLTANLSDEKFFPFTANYLYDDGGASMSTKSFVGCDVTPRFISLVGAEWTGNVGGTYGQTRYLQLKGTKHDDYRDALMSCSG